MPSYNIYKFKVKTCEGLFDLLKWQKELVKTDINKEKNLIRIVCAPSGANGRSCAYSAMNLMRSRGFEPEFLECRTSLNIHGMHCKSCEVVIEKEVKAACGERGIRSVDVSADSGVAQIVSVSPITNKIASINRAIEKYGYKIMEYQMGGMGGPKFDGNKNFERGRLQKERPKALEMILIFTVVLLLGRALSKLGVFKPTVALGDTVSFASVFVLGLLAASSSCIATSGGLMLSATAKLNEKYKDSKSRIKTIILFIAGRIIGYGVLGGLIGIMGKSLALGPRSTGLISIAAALYMLAAGLDMLNIAPQWLKRILPKMPKFLSRKAIGSENGNANRENFRAPFFLGAATFFLPCGFTQALQIYALTTGSFLTSAGILFAFALGTAPVLLALGVAGGAAKGNVGKTFFKFAGAAVIMLGLWNIQNGLNIAGYSLPGFKLADSAISGSNPRIYGGSNGGDADGAGAVVFEDGKQIVNMKVGYYGYEPSNITIKAGIPTVWNINGDEVSGCSSVIQIPKLGIRKLLSRGNNVIEFGPQAPGTINFSCSMGMFRGRFNVAP